MAENPDRPGTSRRSGKLRFRLRPAGWAAAASALLLFLLAGGRHAGAPALTLVLGLAGLMLLSFLFITLALPAALRKLRFADPENGGTGGFGLLPGYLKAGESRRVSTDPSRPAFLPGVRAASAWRLRFGVLRQELRIPLSAV